MSVNPKRRQTVFDICDFGAVGDGATDDTLAIKSAIEAAAAVKGTVIVPPGEYVTGRQKLYPNISIKGDHAWGFRGHGGSILLLRDGETDCMFDAAGAVNIALCGLTLHGRSLGEQVHGLLMDKTEPGQFGGEDCVTVDTCKICYFSGDGLHYRHGWCNQIRHSFLCFNRGSGLWMNSADGFFVDNWFTANGHYGIYAAEGVNNSAVNFTSNRIEWNECGGLRIDCGGIWTVTGNNFDSNSGPALELGGQYAGHFAVSGNFFNRNGNIKAGDNRDESYSAHIRCENCSNLTFSSNGFMQGVDDGNVGHLRPEHVAVFKDCTQTVFCLNTMDMDGIVVENSTEEVIIKDNPVGIRWLVKPDWAK